MIREGSWKTLFCIFFCLSSNGNIQNHKPLVDLVVQAMVQQAMQYIDKTPDLDSKVELIQTLNNVFAGKIYVEIERARLIKKLAKIKEEQGKIAEAEFLSLLPPIYS